MYPWAGRTTQTLIRGAGEICFIVALLTGASIADPGSRQAARHMPPPLLPGDLTVTLDKRIKFTILECGPMPNLMVALLFLFF